ncbi:MAG: branched-chain amino acid ABC transporter permease [Thermoleophilia bacterium]|nr:branched-chain amino acid ABC transporter permease [Thermoleophilia bacterium]
MISSSILSAGFINGLCLAGLYILIALGIALILSIMDILQFAHGEVYMLGAYFTYFIVVRLGGNPYLAIFISMLATGLLGFILERVVFRPLIGKFLPVVCAATGLTLIFQTSAVLGFGLDVKHLPSIWTGSYQVLGFALPTDKLVALGVSAFLTVALFAFLKLTRFGLALMATAQNREGALLQGINPKVMYAFVMTVGSALAAIAGSFGGSIFLLDPFMGSTALMKGFTIIVLGGMGSLAGVVVGGLIYGLADSLVATIFGSEIATYVPMILVMIILVLRPQGLWGRETG